MQRKAENEAEDFSPMAVPEMFKAFFSVFDQGVATDVEQDVSENEQGYKAAPAESCRAEQRSPDFAEQVVVKPAVIFVKTIGKQQTDVVVQFAQAVLNPFADQRMVNQQMAEEHSPEKTGGAEQAQPDDR